MKEFGSALPALVVVLHVFSGGFDCRDARGIDWRKGEGHVVSEGVELFQNKKGFRHVEGIIVIE